MREKYLGPELSDQKIQGFSGEELYACIENLFPQDSTETAASCLKRLFELIQQDVSSESAAIDEDGRVTVTMRVLEPHLFSKIIAAMSYCPELFLRAAEAQDLAQYALAYIKRHSMNFSFEDKSLAMTGLLSFANPTPGRFVLGSYSNQPRAHKVCQGRGH